MENIIQDFRYAWRMMRKSPSFTAVVLLTLALGIGANTAIFSVVDAVLLRPLSFHDPGRLVFVWSADKGRGMNQSTVSIPDFNDWRRQTQTFTDLTAYSRDRFNISGGVEPEQVDGFRTTSNFLDVLGVRPELGRTFSSDEEDWSEHRVVILGHALWMQSFGGNPAVVGQTVTLNAEPFTVIGVLPAGVSLPDEHVQLLVPASIPPDISISRYNRFLHVIARLKPGVTLQRAQTDIGTIASRLAETYSEDKGVTAYLVPAEEQLLGHARPALFVVLGAVGFVMLIACANVASLFLARSAERQTEFAIRASLGSGRLRLARQLLAESLLLSFVGGGLGILLAVWGTRLLRALAMNQIPRANAIHMDAWVLFFAAALSLVTGLAFGLMPALQASMRAPQESLTEAGRSLGGGRNRRTRNLLAISEIALALMLLVGAGLLIQSFRQLRAIDPGFNAERVLTVEVSLPFSKYREDKRRVEFFRELLDSIRALPGVKAAGATMTMPLGAGERYWMDMELGDSAKSGAKAATPIVSFSQITPGYLQAMRIPLLKGRAFDEEDNENSPKVALISESLARHYFANTEAIGKHIRINSVPLTVVGVVRDVVLDRVADSGLSEVYALHSQWPSGASGDMVLAIRAVSDPLNVAASVRDQVRSLDRDQAVANILTLEQTVGSSLGEPRLQTLLLAVFAGLSLLLAAIGIYGVLSYSVAQRTHEIGVRMALGAERRHVLRQVVAQGLVLILTGIGFGLAGALALSRFLSSMLYAVEPIDPPTFLVVSLILTTVAISASYIPARRASKVDPMVALRYE